MNGDVQPAPAGNPVTLASTNGSSENIPSEILRALETVYNPRTSHETRVSATTYLDSFKKDEQVLQYGYALSEASQPIQVRFYGLTLLDHVIQYEWHQLDDEQGTQVRQYVLALGQATTLSDPLYLRNKFAQLWIGLAKRSWALDWFDLDEELIRLWQKNQVSRIFVLAVLEGLSEDVFIREDPVAVLRGKDLSSALVNIFTSSSEHTGDIKIGQSSYQIRSGSEGWLVRINQFLRECLHADVSSHDVRSCIRKVLATLRSVFAWAMTPSIASSGCLDNICICLSNQDTDLLMAAIETFHTLYGRSRLEDSDIDCLVYPICHPNNVALLRQVYSWTVVGTDEMDSPKYAISKKLSEVLSHIAELIAHKPPTDATALELSHFFGLMISVAEHESLIVSIPLVHAWAKLLGQSYWRKSRVIASYTGKLLQLASSRTLQYELMPEEANDPAVIFVHEELELYPERQGFFLNYRRFCCTIIELVTYAYLDEAIRHILQEVDTILDRAHGLEDSFDPTSYAKNSAAALQSDAQFTIVESAFKGFGSWRSAHIDTISPEEADMLAATTTLIRDWSVGLLSRRTFKDPTIRQRIIKSAVEISNRALKNDTEFASGVLEYIINAIMPNESQNIAYSEAVDDLQIYATSELIRLAVHYADYFVTHYERLEQAIAPKISSPDFHDAARVGLNASLFLIVQRASNIDQEVRKNRLWGFLDPVLQAWRDSRVHNILSSFEDFVEAMSFNKVGPYMVSINAAHISDWPNVELDSNGTELRDEMKSKTSILQLRLTRTMLQVSTDKLGQDTSAYRLICELWAPIIPTVFEAIVRLVSFNHRLHDPSAWPGLTIEMEGIAGKILQDRYWQSGISDLSMMQFHAKIKSSKDSLEGFASSVRGRIRLNLENGYSILLTLGRLGDLFYSLPHMSEVMSRELVGTVGSLSPHHFSVLLTMLIKLVDECPPPHRLGFLPSLLGTLFFQLHEKCTTEWATLEKRKETKAREDELSDEMRDDSILRNFTYKAVNMVALWIDPREAKAAPRKPNSHGEDLAQYPSVRDVIMTHSEIIVPLLKFCSRALRWHDTKTCSNVVRALRMMVPAFATGPAVSSEFAVQVRSYISGETLGFAMLALNDSHFVEQQKDIANLIATIWIAYGLPTHIPATEMLPAHERPPLDLTWRNTMLGAPGMTEEKINGMAEKLAKEGGVTGNARHQRALVLNLFEGLRGVRLSEHYKIDDSKQKSKLMEQYMKRDSMGMQGVEDGVQPSNIEGEGLDLGGVSEMFS